MLQSDSPASRSLPGSDSPNGSPNFDGHPQPAPGPLSAVPAPSAPSGSSLAPEGRVPGQHIPASVHPTTQEAPQPNVNPATTPNQPPQEFPSSASLEVTPPGDSPGGQPQLFPDEPLRDCPSTPISPSSGGTPFSA